MSERYIIATEDGEVTRDPDGAPEFWRDKAGALRALDYWNNENFNGYRRDGDRLVWVTPWKLYELREVEG